MEASESSLRRILVVDDEPAAAELARRYLSPHDFVVETAFSGLEAVEKIEGGHFDVVLSDVRMPNGSGIDLLREMRRLEQSLPLILMSADLEGAKAQAKALGAAAFVRKPLEREDLLAVVMQVLGAACPVPVAGL